MLPLAITAYSVVCAAGFGRRALFDALQERRGSLTPNDFTAQPLPTWIGRVADLEAPAWDLPAALAPWACRNNRLAWAGLNTDGFKAAVAAARDRYGPRRVALVMGTSTAAIDATEAFYRHLDDPAATPANLRQQELHTPHSLGHFVQRAVGLEGPCFTIATACSSSAKVFCQAERLMRLGLCDAVVVGGVDTLCNSVLYGFASLELLSAQICRPFAVDRRGLNIGEAAGFALLERTGSDPGSELRLLGYGETSDAYHMSAPHPEGLGARLAIEQALARGGCRAEQIQYINLHGTATPKNDAVEARVVADMFPASTRASSTKGWTGHTLGAAGCLEAIISWLSLQTGLIPGTLNTQQLDAQCGPQIQLENSAAEVRLALSNSFGFGGSNCVLLFGRAAA
ncbi:MAG TPA: beta-ketoacyl-[acyl-carrier-protein] synthase family protein [Steroidobacteraceae bacterium]|jgi:3-oxoacyl-[acyl-carrier-protein] synthase-1|nr:beta-ketoacyl-[acyl-carrier-protein] synthase family protein [Steroidobacteraceae bacterium]